MYRPLLAWIVQLITGWVIVLGSCLVCAGQQAGLIDLSQDMPQHELRRPPAQPGDPIKHIGSEEHYNDCTHTPADPAIQTTVIGADHKEYKEGDEQKFEVRLTNVGSSPVKIPFSGDLADLQPADPGTKFTYFELAIQVWVVGGEAWNANTGGSVVLYGSDDHPQSFLELKPSEWLEVFGRGKINAPSDSQLPARSKNPVTEINAEVTFEKKESIFTSTEAATVAHSVCLKRTRGPNLPLALQERQSENH